MMRARLRQFRSKRLFALLGSVLLVAVIFIWPHPAWAQGLTIKDSIAVLLGNVVLWLLQTVALLATLFIHILIIVAQYNHFIDVPIVKTGWGIVKDIANMMFIIALLVIAVGTILRLENYRYNRLLGRLIVMAFLVNFSMLIAGFFIQFGQVVMLTFVNAFAGAAFGNFATMFGLDKVLKFASTAGVLSSIGDSVLSLIAGLALMVVAMVVILAICVILAVRIVALWVLIILSPLAYALRLLPNTENLFSQWWREFTKYVTVGPVLAFFLWLSLSFFTSSANNTDTGISSSFSAQEKIYEQEHGAVPQSFGSELFTLDTFATFFMSIIFLVMALQYATRSGGLGGNFAAKVATSGFAAGATLTGLNAVRGAIRDRTVAPIQGYLAQRRSRGEAAVRDRTIGLSTAVDRGLSATVGQVGRGRAAVTGAIGAGARAAWQRRPPAEIGQAISEGAQLGAAQGTRAFRQAQGRISQAREAEVDREGREKNMPNATENELRAMRNSGNWRTRMAATELAAQRGQIHYDDPNEMNQVTRDLQSIQNNPELRQKMAGAFSRGISSGALDRAQLELILNNPRFLEEIRLAGGERLIDRGMIDDNVQGRDTLRNIEQIANTRGADKGREVRRKAYDRVEDAAIRAFHEPLVDPAATPAARAVARDDLLEAVANGEARQSAALKRRIFTDRNEANVVGQRLTEIAKQKGQLAQLGSGSDQTTRNYFFRNVDFNDPGMGAVDIEDRAQFTNATGHGHRAFRGRPAGELAEYTAHNRDNFADRASQAMVEDDEFMGELWRDPNFGYIGMTRMANRGSGMNNALRASQQRIRNNPGAVGMAQETYNRADPNYGTWRTFRAVEGHVSGSVDLHIDTANADPAVRQQANAELAQYFRSIDGFRLRDVDQSQTFRNDPNGTLMAIGQHLRSDQVPSFAAGNMPVAQQAISARYNDPALTPAQRLAIANDPNKAGLW